MKPRSLAVLCAAIAFAIVSIDARASDSNVLRIRTLGNETIDEYAFRFADLKVMRISSIACKSSQRNKCPVQPESSAWRMKQRNDAILLRQHDINIPSYEAIPPISRDGATFISQDTAAYNFVRLQDHTHIEFHRVPGRSLVDSEWIGENGCFLLLTRQSVIDLKPWNWLFAFSGHPVQRDTYYLELRAPNGLPIAEETALKDIRNTVVFLTRGAATQTEYAEQSEHLPNPC